MKILFLSSLSAAYRTSYNFRLERLARGLEELGCETEFLYLGDCSINRPALLHPLNLTTIRKKSMSADFIHAGGTGCAYVCALLKNILNKPIIYDAHGDTIFENWEARRCLLDPQALVMTLQSMVMEKVAARLEFYIVCSQPLADLFRRKGISPERIAIIRNGADTRFFTPECSTPCVKTEKRGPFIFGYAGGNHYYQGLDILLQAAEFIQDSNIEIRVAGVRQPLDCPPNVKYYGKLEHQAIPEFIGACDVMLIPRPDSRAIYYSSATKFAEYVAAGKPVLATDVSEISTFIKKSLCGIVTGTKPEDLSIGMRQFASLSREALCRMGQNARKLALEVFDLRKIAQEYLSYLEKHYDI